MNCAETIYLIKRIQKDWGMLYAAMAPLEESTEAWELRRMYSITGEMIVELRLALQLCEDDMIDEFKQCFWEKPPPEPW